MADVTKDILINVNVETGDVNSKLTDLNQQVNSALSVDNKNQLQGFDSVRKQIAEARNEAIKLKIAIDEGQKSGENIQTLRDRYQEVTKRAAGLRDAVEDVNQRISDSNPDNRLQGLISVAQGAIAAVQGVAGAFTLVGVDAETANVAIAKLQGLIALGNAIGQIDKITIGMKAFGDAIQGATIFQRLNNTATVAATAIQQAFGASVVGTGAAFTALRAAILSTGIGALIIALGAVVNILIDFATAESKAEQAAAKTTDELERQVEAYRDLEKQIGLTNRIEIAELQAQGAKTSAIRQAQLRQRKEALERAEEIERKAAQDYNENFFTTTRENGERLKKALKDASDAVAQARAEVRLQQLDNELQTNKDLEEIRKQNLDRVRQNRDERVAIEREFNEILQQFRLENRRRGLSDIQQELLDINLKFQKAIEFAKKYNKDTVELEKLRQEALKQAVTQQIQTNALDIARRRVQNIEEAYNYEISNLERIQNKLTVARSTLDQQQIADYEAQAKASNIKITRLFSEYATQRLSELRLLREDELKKSADIGGPLGAILGSLVTGKTAQADLQSQLLQQNIQNRDLINQAYDALERDLKTEVSNRQLQLQKSATQTKLFIGIFDLRRAQEETRQILRKLEDPFVEPGTELESPLERWYKKTFSIPNFRNLNIYDKDGNIISREEINRSLENFIFTTQKNAKDVAEKTGKDFSVDPLISIFTLGAGTGKAFTTRLEAIFQTEAEAFRLRAQELDGQYQIDIAKATVNNENLLALEQKYLKDKENLNREYKDRIKSIDDEIYQNKVALARLAAGTFGQLAQLADEGSDLSKAAGLVEVAINTGVAISNAQVLALKASSLPGPAGFFAYPILYATILTQVLAAAARAKQIINQAKPGGGGSQAAAASSAIPPTINTSLFNLPQNVQNVRVTNQPGQDVVRAFITNDELRTNAEKQNFLNKLSSF